MVWVVVALTVVLVVVLAGGRALRGRATDDRRGLDGNDPARPGAVDPADARGAVNRHSWMLGGGGSGG